MSSLEIKYYVLAYIPVALSISAAAYRVLAKNEDYAVAHILCFLSLITLAASIGFTLVIFGLGCGASCSESAFMLPVLLGYIVTLIICSYIYLTTTRIGLWLLGILRIGVERIRKILLNTANGLAKIYKRDRN